MYIKCYQSFVVGSMDSRYLFSINNGRTRCLKYRTLDPQNNNIVEYLIGRKQARTTGKIILMYGQGVNPNTQSTSRFTSWNIKINFEMMDENIEPGRL